MKPNYTHIIFLVDRSGSMSLSVDDTIGGYNSFIKAHQEAEGTCTLTTVLFDHEQLTITDTDELQDIKSVEPLTTYTYLPRGSTSLLDAVGTQITYHGDLFTMMHEDDRPDKVILVVLTDGHENNSREYTPDMVKALVKEHQEQWNWEVIYLSAGLDSAEEADSYGVVPQSYAGGAGQSIAQSFTTATRGSLKSRAGQDVDLTQ